MREIKFRAWRKNVNSMQYFDTIAFLEFQDDVLIYQKQPSEEPHGIDEVSKDIILMQYTGLKDKDDKEILEKDIVKTPNGKLHVVRYNHGGFEPVMYYENKTMTILGNIYENPELLEV